jgi:hypothetical protein
MLNLMHTFQLGTLYNLVTQLHLNNNLLNMLYKQMIIQQNNIQCHRMNILMLLQLSKIRLDKWCSLMLQLEKTAQPDMMCR